MSSYTQIIYIHHGSQIYRLRAGAVPWAGRVEIHIDGVWGTICDAEFDVLEGNIICRRLGYGSVKTISGQAGYGRGVGTIHLTKIRLAKCISNGVGLIGLHLVWVILVTYFVCCSCTGTENRIEDCVSTTGRRAQRCGHQSDVGLECNTPATHQCSRYTLHNVTHYFVILDFVMLEHLFFGIQVTMVESEDHTYPQVKGTSGWGLFCHSSTPVVTRKVGEVICRQTRRQFLARISNGSGPAGYSGLRYSGSIRCTGSEILLSKCNVKIIPQSSCPEGYTIVNCTPGINDYT